MSDWIKEALEARIKPQAVRRLLDEIKEKAISFFDELVEKGGADENEAYILTVDAMSKINKIPANLTSYYLDDHLGLYEEDEEDG